MSTKLEFTVERIRHSVTQGEAAVYCNGVKLIQYGDTITMNGEHAKIGNWGSEKPDADFILATIFPCDIRKNYYPAEANAIKQAITDLANGKSPEEVQKSLTWLFERS